MWALFSFKRCFSQGHGTLPVSVLPLANDGHLCAIADHSTPLRSKPGPLANKFTRRSSIRNIFCFDSPMRMLFAA
jgi:hypothetical protein